MSALQRLVDAGYGEMTTGELYRAWRAAQFEKAGMAVQPITVEVSPEVRRQLSALAVKLSAERSRAVSFSEAIEWLFERQDGIADGF